MNSNRWWEFYFVRYAMGTLVGAAVAYFLARELQLFGVDQNEMSFYEAAALLSAGLTFLLPFQRANPCVSRRSFPLAKYYLDHNYCDASRTRCRRRAYVLWMYLQFGLYRLA